ncbi:MAG: MraY family glycosyltransferase [Armatimonadota bacterium]|nr:MraY family glycosyltransferase [Armatimonadota bacterium]MDR5698127.1 MraY family glycosyltransferase [Armatimonadota bacterium]
MFIPPYVLAAVLAWFVTYWTTPTARWVARRVGAVDFPGGRRINRRPLPRLGGIALFAGILGAALLTLPIRGDIAVVREPRYLVLAVPYAAIAPEYVGVLLGAVAISLLGLYDDVRPLSGAVKFPLIYLAAAIPTLFGVSASFVTNPISGQLLPLGVYGQIFTVLWIGSVAIAMNLIDGVDGLAAGIAAIVSATLFAATLARPNLPMMILCAAVVGSAVGFLRYNFNPARIIMGDGGAMLLGYLLGAMSVLGVFKTITALSLAVPLLAMGVPIFDTAFAILRRARRGLPIFHPDRGHLHHRLLDRGLTQRQTVFLLYGATGLLGTLALIVADSVDRHISVGLAVILTVTLLVFARRLGLMAPARGPLAGGPPSP